MMSVPNTEPCIGLLNCDDFIRAKELLENFDQWEAFQDYLDDREGLRMGLAFAGRSIQIASVSLDSFLAWCRATGERATAERLDEFASLTEAVRRARYIEVHPRLERQGNDGHHREPFISVPVDLQAYEAWVACLQECSSSALLEAYARFIVEAWVEFHVPEIAVR